MKSKEYYEKIASKWEKEYPSSGNIDEMWDFYKECGYKDPQDTIRNLLNGVEWNKASMLDLGCDNGFMLKTICDWFPSVSGIGIDINSNAIKKAQTFFPEYTFETFNGIKIPYEDKSFDLVLVCAVVKHIRYEDREKFYSEILRVADSVLFIEKDSKIEEEVNQYSWTFYHSDFEKEFEEFFEPLEITHEGGDLLGLYRCR
ncbi:class I SAM-dependent methyltransferase [Bacteriovoracaceae bacterium]|nr:class I SAM-dependent methyltransferase [Bacteriovoracaceae bacterium]